MKKIIITILILINILCICLVVFHKKNIKLETNDSVIKKMVNVDIKGAVKNPGLKVLEVNSTVNDLIEQSGGLLETADTSLINLSKKLKDEMVVIIYTKSEVNEMKSGQTSVKIIEKECICPKLENDACISNDDISKVDNENTVNGNRKVNLNTATKEEIMTLSGIGETKANSIIEYRKTNPFTSIEELKNVKGIGESTFEKIKDNLTV